VAVVALFSARSAPCQSISFPLHQRTLVQTQFVRAPPHCQQYGRGGQLGVQSHGALVELSARMCEGDEASVLSLPAYLQLMTDSCVESPCRVLRDLRVTISSAHTRRRCSCTRMRRWRLRTCCSKSSHCPRRLGHRRALQVSCSWSEGARDRCNCSLRQLLQLSRPRSHSIERFRRAVLLSRSIDELVNIPPGSKQMSESLPQRSRAPSATRPRRSD